MGEGTGGASEGERPAARCSERVVYGGAGMDGRGGGERFLDCPVLMQIDEDGDGTFERVRRYVQDSNGDVVAVIENPRVYQAGTANEVSLPTPNLIVRYTVSGEPLFFGEPGADFDQDDDIDSDDLVSLFAAWDEGDIAADTDADQDTDSEDLVLFIQWFENGVGQTGTVYHYTTSRNVTKIVEQGVIRGSRRYFQSKIVYATTIQPAYWPYFSWVVGVSPAHHVAVRIYQATQQHWNPFIRTVQECYPLGAP